MKTLVIVIHPNLETSVVNKTWMNRLKQEKDITVHDLYGEYPNFIIDVEKEQQLLLDRSPFLKHFNPDWFKGYGM